jgi:hypothetical protein
MQQRLIVKDAARTTDPNDVVIDALNEALVADVSNLDNVSVHVVQVNDAGTVSLVLEISADGQFFAPFGAAIPDTDFAPGPGTVIPRTLSDANGMPLVMGQVRVRAGIFTGAGSYRVKVVGKERA